MLGFQNILNSNLVVLSFIIYIISIVLVIYLNPLNVATNYSQIVNSFFVIVGILNLLLYILFKYRQPGTAFQTVPVIFRALSSMIFLLLVSSVIFVIGYFIFLKFSLLGSLVTVLNIGIVVGILAMVYKLWFSKLKPGVLNNELRLLQLIIFYLPCLLIDLVDYIKYQFKITTKTTWLILLIELIIVILRFSIPQLYKKFSAHNGTIALKGPVYLNKHTDIGVFQNLIKTESSTNTLEKSPFDYNYALSSWIWINPEPPSTSPAYNESTSLLNYGDILQINLNKTVLEIKAATTNDATLNNSLVTVYKTNMFPYQKWNNIVMNYAGGTLDVFINNKLVSSTENITPIMEYSNVSCGSSNGIHGGIKDVMYYNKVLSRNKIHSIYNF